MAVELAIEQFRTHGIRECGGVAVKYFAVRLFDLSLRAQVLTRTLLKGMTRAGTKILGRYTPRRHPLNANRPFFNHSISDLEKAFDERSSEADFLDVLAIELTHRQANKAIRLAEHVRAARAEPPATILTNQRSVPTEPHATASRRTEQRTAVDRIETPMPAITNAPVQVLDAWAALEVLNPQTFARPQELAVGGEAALVADFRARGLPWEAGDVGRRDKRVFYHVIIGSIDVPAAFHALLERFAGALPNPPRLKGEAVLASVIVDKLGLLASDSAVIVSSFGWGLPIALTQELTGLAQWPSNAQRLEQGLDRQLRLRGEDGQERPIGLSAIQNAYEWLIGELNLPSEYVRPPRFAIRQFQDFRLQEPPDSLLLNSFYLRDLARARAQFVAGSAPAALRAYVGQDAPANRRDLLHDTAALEEAIAPKGIPLARWPVPGRHPLVLLQQAAVNLALKDGGHAGIVAVNGPPGTGKTTLLRDVVAALVAQRAEAMCRFDDPARAFSDSGQTIRIKSESTRLYTVDRSLRGFEILMASSNNKAVENVSAELPALTAVASDAGLSYFTALSDAMLGRPTWGLIAAVLGNAANRYKFTQTFWWDSELGLATYLAEAAGTPQWVVPPGSDGTTQGRRPRIVDEAAAPSSHAEAIKRWEAVRASFRQHSEAASLLLTQLDAVRTAVQNLPRLSMAAASAGAAAEAAEGQEAHAKRSFHNALAQETAAKSILAKTIERLRAHDATKPSFFACMFRTATAKQWLAIREPLAAQHKKTESAHTERAALASRLEAEWKAAISVASKAKAAAQLTETARAEAERNIIECRERLGARLVDTSYFEQPHEVRHQSVPWCDAATHRIRDELFVAAMAVHKAFIDAAAKPIRGNLAGLIKAMGSVGTAAFADRKAPLLQEVWATLFLVVPVVSTTFASVERMLGALPSESLGWLLIDEAGQAMPQAAVGAISRARRAVVVGDPVQIEPVVPLPDRLTQAICRRFGVDPDCFNAPEASAQTLADAATPYMAEFQGKSGSRTVGVPLLVHRRCAEPMFGIANGVAYQHLMVYAKQPHSSAIKDCLGPSRWIDIAGSGRDKWCPEEGEAVLELLRQLADARVEPNLYIISPFRAVEESLSRLILERGVLQSLTTDPRKWVGERVGTVHTAQGREAEAVIFVLGAPEMDQSGARGWAGGKPNLLNVALTRAQEAIYVVGNRRLWRDAGVFHALDAGMNT